jgi:hypothetical protein
MSGAGEATPAEEEEATADAEGDGGGNMEMTFFKNSWVEFASKSKAIW